MNNSANPATTLVKIMMVFILTKQRMHRKCSTIKELFEDLKYEASDPPVDF
jgi:hypothetical protein